MPINRDFDFTPGDVIRSTQVDSEFDKLYGLLDGTDIAHTLFIGRTTALGGATEADLAAVFGRQVQIIAAVEGSVLALYKEGDAVVVPRINLLNNGQIRVAASQSTNQAIQYMVLGGTLYVSNTPIGNINAGEDDLHTFEVAANVMNVTRAHLHYRAAGITAANDNDKRIKFKVDGNTSIDSGIFQPNNEAWFFDLDIFSDPGVAEWRVVGIFVCGTLEIRRNGVIAAVDHSQATILKVTGEGVATDDIIQHITLITKGMSIN